MDKVETIKTIKGYVAEGKTEDTLELLLKYTDSLEPTSYNEAVLLSGQFMQWKRSSMLGI